MTELVADLTIPTVYKDVMAMFNNIDSCPSLMRKLRRKDWDELSISAYWERAWKPGAVTAFGEGGVVTIYYGLQYDVSYTGWFGRRLKVYKERLRTGTSRTSDEDQDMIDRSLVQSIHDRLMLIREQFPDRTSVARNHNGVIIPLEKVLHLLDEE